jgi:hypothetical protein
MLTVKSCGEDTVLLESEIELTSEGEGDCISTLFEFLSGDTTAPELLLSVPLAVPEKYSVPMPVAE